jgi:hypothetical protein
MTKLNYFYEGTHVRTAHHESYEHTATEQQTDEARGVVSHHREKESKKNNSTLTTLATSPLTVQKRITEGDRLVAIEKPNIHIVFVIPLFLFKEAL